MDTMTEHWGHLIGRTLEPPPGEDDGESPAGAAAPVAAGDADGGSTTGEGDGSCTLDDDVTNGDGAGGPSGDSAFPTSSDGASTNGESDGNLASGSAILTPGDGASSNVEGDGNPVPPTSGGAPSLPSTVVEMENERAYILKLRICLKQIYILYNIYFFSLFPLVHYVIYRFIPLCHLYAPSAIAVSQGVA